MNKEVQRGRIQRFLDGKGKIDVDAFCIYQWIERCHFEGWWEIAVLLSPNVPPNSLDLHYHKRLDFLLNECRRNFEIQKKEFITLKNPNSLKSFLVPEYFWTACSDMRMNLAGGSNAGLRLDYLGMKVVFLKLIDYDGCVFEFFDMEPNELSSWLNSNGFEHLVRQIQWPRKTTQAKKSRLKIAWQDAANLIPSFMEKAKENSSWHPFVELIKAKSWDSWQEFTESVIKAFDLDEKGKKAKDLKNVILSRWFRVELSERLFDAGYVDLAKRYGNR